MENKEKKKKWEFEDYAFTLTGIIVVLLLVVPELLYALFDVIFLGGSLDTNLGDDYWLSTFTLHDFRALSPLLFLFTTAIVFIKDAVDARKTGGYTGSLFRHTFESLVEDAIYMSVTTVMVFFAVFADTMYISWLAGPLTWVLFIFLFPFIRRKRSDYEADPIPWLLLLIFAAGIITELITGVWIAFPLAWLVICAFKLVGGIREFDKTLDSVFDILYYAFSVVLMAVGVVFDFWIASWAAFPIAIAICWVVKKFGKYKTQAT